MGNGNPHSDPRAKDAIPHARGGAASSLKPWFLKQTIGSLLDAFVTRAHSLP